MLTLKQKIAEKKFIRAIESHNGLTALIAEKASAGKSVFDAVWLGSLSDSLIKGRPDMNVIDTTSKLETIRHIKESTAKPILMDGDNGGLPEHFPYMVRSLDDAGVSAIVIEDKVGLKINSLSKANNQKQEDMMTFSRKITMGKEAQLSQDFMIFARIESLIIGKPIEDAISRARNYIKAGADGIMIHSKQDEEKQIFEFCKEYNELKNRAPLLVIPTTYHKVQDVEWKQQGVNVVVYANHLLRSAYKAMWKTAISILEHGRASEIEGDCISIEETLSLIPGSK
jgi:phosphoenolpyruvate phosphomutase